MENFTINQILSTTNAAFDMLAKSLHNQSNLQSDLGNYELANQLQEQADQVLVMSYYVKKELKKQ